MVVVVGQSENNGGVTFQHQLCSTKTLIHKIFSSATLDNTPTYKSHPYSVLALPNPELDIGLIALFSVFPYNSLQVHQFTNQSRPFLRSCFMAYIRSQYGMSRTN